MVFKNGVHALTWLVNELEDGGEGGGPCVTAKITAILEGHLPGGDSPCFDEAVHARLDMLRLLEGFDRRDRATLLIVGRDGMAEAKDVIAKRGESIGWALWRHRNKKALATMTITPMIRLNQIVEAWEEKLFENDYLPPYFYGQADTLSA